jgi:hypothetical protein
MNMKDLVSETLSRVSENADADNALKDNSHRSTTPISVPPHLEGLVDKNAAQRARDRNAQTDANLSSIPKFEKA